MNNFFKISKFWTFEQIGSRQDQMFKFLGQVNSEIFKTSIHRNVIGTIVSFPIHYFFDPIFSSCLLFGVGIVQFHSIYKYKQCTKVLGYYKDQKHLLKGISSIPSAENSNLQTDFPSQFTDESKFQSSFSKSFDTNSFTKSQSDKTQSNYEKYLQDKQHQAGQQANESYQDQLNDSGQIKDAQIRYIEVENTAERMKYYNRQLFCMGLLQGLFLGSYTDIWDEGYIYATHLTMFMNSILNGYLFSHFYQNNYNMSSIKAMIIGSLTPLPLCLVAPVIFNNGLLQSNLIKSAQKLFLSENINQDPSLFIVHRKGIRLFGLCMLYFVILSILLGDVVDEIEEDNDEDDDNNKKNKNTLNWVIQFKVDDGNKIQENIEALRKFNKDKDQKAEEAEKKPKVAEEQNKK